jgi:tetratricopeptide (TPR) repeat protein
LLVLAGDRDDIGLLRAEQAKQAARTGQPERALMLAQEALEALKADARHAPSAWHAFGIAHAAVGDVPAANAAFARAVDGLSEQRNWRQAAHAARDWGQALREAGRSDKAYALFERAMLVSLRESGAEARSG